MDAPLHRFHISLNVLRLRVGMGKIFMHCLQWLQRLEKARGPALHGASLRQLHSCTAALSEMAIARWTPMQIRAKTSSLLQLAHVVSLFIQHDEATRHQVYNKEFAGGWLTNTRRMQPTKTNPLDRRVAQVKPAPFMVTFFRSLYSIHTQLGVGLKHNFSVASYAWCGAFQPEPLIMNFLWLGI